MIRKPTEVIRATCIQELRVILGPEAGPVPVGGYRKVQVMIPPSPTIFLMLDVDPRELGLNRTYKVPVMSSGARLELHLLPHQFIIAASEERIGDVSLVVEYLGGV